MVQKHKSRNDEDEQSEFKKSVQKLFDIAPQDVFDQISEEKKMFLLDQRSDDRLGYIANIPTRQEVQQEELSRQTSSFSLHVKGNIFFNQKNNIFKTSLTKKQII